MEKEVNLQLMGDPDAVGAANALLLSVFGDAFEAPRPATRGGRGLCQCGLVRLEVASPAAREPALEAREVSATRPPDIYRYHVAPEGEGLARLIMHSFNNWRPLVQADRADEAARVIADLDYIRAEFPAFPVYGPIQQYDAARRAVSRLLRGSVLKTEDRETATMLGYFGFRPWSQR